MIVMLILELLKMYTISRKCRLCNKKMDYLGSVPIKTSRYSNQNTKPIKSALATGYKPHELDGTLDGTTTEEYYFWSKSQSKDGIYTLILPPPNITGTLHLGHALTASIQDALVKWNKMQGRQTLWVPGLDHAGIATQVQVEKKLWKEKGLTRHDLGRDKFEQMVWEWKHEKSSTIIQQLKRLNVSLDWDRETFTMDQKHSQAVTEAFIRLFDLGLIYRADYLVNWSCTLRSAISDIEVDHIEVDGTRDIAVPGYDKPVKFGVLTKFAYKFENSEDEIIVATTRPETILGDVAVAVNPKDSRYTQFIGKRLRHPFRNEVIPVIADELVDPEFGTGAVKITPAHDPVDFEAGKRHNLQPVSVINEIGLLTDNCGEFKGAKRFEARETIINRLAERRLLRGSLDHKMSVPFCSRSKDVVEFLIKPQWFLNYSKMAEKAMTDVREGRLKIEPEHFEKTWYQWLGNIREWCISRQLWWGHRIPAYSCRKKDSNNNEVIWVAAESYEAAKVKASDVLICDCEEVQCIQDEDVLDTWFSSGLLPLSAFGWPEMSEDLNKHYPLTIMETGHDILFFWVSRMVMLGSQLTGHLPFNQILLHGVICDVYGRKMSKSLGNVIAPEDIIDGSSLERLNMTLEENFRSGLLSSEELKKATLGQQKMFPNGIPECGADALRFTLLSHNIKNHVINFDVNECHTNRLFGNKIWQATKFTLLWIEKVAEAQPVDVFLDVDDSLGDLAPMDRWILSRLTFLLQCVNDAFDKRNFHVATAALKNFLYYEFCDVYLESVKTNLKEKTGESVSKSHCKTLLTCLDQSLRALAPFMPLLAQHLHEHLPRLWGVGLDRSFPKGLNLRDETLEHQVEEINQIAICIRRLKKIFNVTFKYHPEVPLHYDVVHAFSQVIKDLSHLYTLHISDEQSPKPQRSGLVEDIVGKTKVYLVVPDELLKSLQVDVAKMEKKKVKLLKELEELNKMIGGNRYKETVAMEKQEIHAKKVSYITEKIMRLDYIRRVAK